MLLRQTLSYLPAQILGPLAQLVSVVAWTHLADERSIGVVTLVVNSQDFLALILVVPWTIFVQRHYREHAAAGRLDDILSSTGLVMGVSIALQVVLAVINLKLFIDPGSDLVLMLVTAAFVSLRAVSACCIVFSVLRKDYVGFTVYSLSGPVIGLCLGLGGLYLFGPNPLWPLLGYVAGEAIAAIYALTKVRIPRVEWEGIRDIVREGVRFGGPLIVSSSMSWLSLNTPRYTINAVLGIEAAGRFAVGFGLGQRAAMLSAMLVTMAAMPLVFSRNLEQGREAGLDQLSQNLALLLSVMTPALVGFWLVSPSLVPLVLEENFWASTLMLLGPSLAASALGAIAAHWVSHILFLDKRTVTLLGVEIVTAAATVVAVIWATNNYGMAGAAQAIVWPRLVSLVVTTAWLVMTMKLKMPWRDIGVLSVAILAMAGAVSMIPNAPTLLTVITKVLIGGFVYVAAIAIAYRSWLRPRAASVIKRIFKTSAAS
jgi:O-antigen/teichoic acid export membrane protein